MDKVQSRIAVIGIIIEDRGMAGQVNELLHKYGAYIIGRMGIPYEKKQVKKAGKASGGQLQGHLFQRKTLGKSRKKGRRITMDQKIREEVFQDCAEDLCRGRRLSRDQWRILLEGRTRERAEKMAEKASALRDRIYGKRIFIRGLIEFTNYCRNDCYYCGIRQQKGFQIPAFPRRDPGMLQGGIPFGIPHLCTPGRGGSLLQ